MHMDQGLHAAIAYWGRGSAVGGLKGWLTPRLEYRSRVEELHTLVKENDKVKVEQLLKGPRQANIKHIVDFELDGMPSLHLAARRGNAEIAELLLEVGQADIHLKTSREGDTPLHVAAQFGHEGVVDKLLQHGAVSDLTARNKLGETPFHAAALGNKPQIVALMLSRAPDPHACLHAKNEEHRTPLHYAAGCQEPKIVELLLGTNGQTLKDCVDKCGALPFHFAARSGHVKSLEMLAPDDINVVSSKNGFTALHYAVWSANKEAVEWLIEKRASVMEQNEAGKLNTPMHLAAARPCKELAACEKIAEMIAANALPSSWKVKNGDGKLAVGMADECEHGEHSHVVRAILQSGLRLAGQHLDGEEIERHRNMPNCATLLHYAAGHGTKDDIEWLMCSASCKELIDIQDASGRTPLHWAAMKGNRSTLEALAKAGANLTKVSSRDETPLFLALGEDHMGFAEELRELGERSASRKDRRRGPAGKGLTTADSSTSADTLQDWMKGVEKWMKVYYDDKVETRVREELSSTFKRLTQRERSDLNMFEEIPPLYLALHAGSLDMAKFFQKLSSISSSAARTDGEDAVNKKGAATGRTPLHWAVLLCKQDIVKQLCCNVPEFREKLLGQSKLVSMVCSLDAMFTLNEK